MKISRLDKIIESNVNYSTQKNTSEQTLYVLQDISMTLAMIYDYMCGMNPVSDASSPVSTMAYVIPFDELDKYESFHFETYDFPEGYESKLIRYYEDELIDAKNDETKKRTFAIIESFGDEMRMNSSSYEKKWRCWNVKPTAEERRKVKWKK